MKPLKFIKILLLGISSVLMMKSCYQKVDARVTGEWVCINETAHIIEVKAKVFNSFILQPGESYTFIGSGEGPENITEKEYISPYSLGGTKVIVNNTDEYVLAKGESITDTENYQVEKLGYNHFRFTYRFTEADFN